MRQIPRKVLAIAIADVEGWFDKPRKPIPLIPHRCLNPGNLRWAPKRFPQAGRDPSDYVIFSSVESGWGALENDLNAKILRGLTLRQLIHIYAPAADRNNPSVYTGLVAQKLRIDPDKVLRDFVVGTKRVAGPWRKGIKAGIIEFGPPKPDYSDLSVLALQVE